MKMPECEADVEQDIIQPQEKKRGGGGLGVGVGMTEIKRGFLF